MSHHEGAKGLAGFCSLNNFECHSPQLFEISKPGTESLSPWQPGPCHARFSRCFACAAWPLARSLALIKNMGGRKMKIQLCAWRAQWLQLLCKSWTGSSPKRYRHRRPCCQCCLRSQWRPGPATLGRWWWLAAAGPCCNLWWGGQCCSNLWWIKWFLGCNLKCTKKNCGCYSWPCLNFSQVPLPNGATLTIASPEPVPGGATHGPGSLPSGPSTSSLSASPTSSLASSPAAGPESGKKRMCLSDLDGLSAAAKEEGWRHLTQSAKRKARKVNYEGWWDDNEKEKDEKDDTQQNADLHPDTSNDSWGPKWPGFGPPKPDWACEASKKHGFYGVFCSENVQKTRKHHLFDHFSALPCWWFLTVFIGFQMPKHCNLRCFCAFGLAKVRLATCWKLRK